MYQFNPTPYLHTQKFGALISSVLPPGGGIACMVLGLPLEGVAHARHCFFRESLRRWNSVIFLLFPQVLQHFHGSPSWPKRLKCFLPWLLWFQFSSLLALQLNQDKFQIISSRYLDSPLPLPCPQLPSLTDFLFGSKDLTIRRRMCAFLLCVLLSVEQWNFFSSQFFFPLLPQLGSQRRYIINLTLGPSVLMVSTSVPLLIHHTKRA